MRREFQMIVLVLLGILCVNIVTAQNVRQKPVVKKQATTTTKKTNDVNGKETVNGNDFEAAEDNSKAANDEVAASCERREQEGCS